VLEVPICLDLWVWSVLVGLLEGETVRIASSKGRLGIFLISTHVFPMV